MRDLLKRVERLEQSSPSEPERMRFVITWVPPEGGPAWRPKHLPPWVPNYAEAPHNGPRIWRQAEESHETFKDRALSHFEEHDRIFMGEDIAP